MDKLLDEMKTIKEYVDIQAEIIDADGISFKRSWTYLSGDDLVKNNQKLAHLIKYPRVETTIEASKYGMMFTNKIPIYEKDRFLLVSLTRSFPYESLKRTISVTTSSFPSIENIGVPIFVFETSALPGITAIVFV